VNDVIPAGYNGKDEAVRDLNFSLKTPLRGGKHLENTGLPVMPAISTRNPRTLKQHWHRPGPGAIQTITRQSPKTVFA